MDTKAQADQIREMASHEFADPQDVHDTLTGMHELVSAMQEVLSQWGETLAETGVHPRYAGAAHEAAGSMQGISEQLEQVTAGGVMRGPGS